MSGVAKDDTNPNSPKDETVPVAGETDAAKADGQATSSAVSASAKDEAEPRARRAAPHLRVVTDNAEDVPAATAEPTARIGEVSYRAMESQIRVRKPDGESYRGWRRPRPRRRRETACRAVR